MYFRNLRRVTVQCILQSTYHRTWETGLEVDMRVKETSNPLFFGGHCDSWRNLFHANQVRLRRSGLNPKPFLPQ